MSKEKNYILLIHDAEEDKVEFVPVPTAKDVFEVVADLRSFESIHKIIEMDAEGATCNCTIEFEEGKFVVKRVPSN